MLSHINSVKRVGPQMNGKEAVANFWNYQLLSWLVSIENQRRRTFDVGPLFQTRLLLRVLD